MRSIFSRLYNNDWFLPLAIFAFCLMMALLYSFSVFKITSDSLIEYNTYLFYVKQGHWSPISDSLLSSSLWTTYLPSVIQNYLHISNPETVYRWTLAVLVSPLPSIVFLLCKRYTDRFVALLMSVVFFSTFYYQGFTAYARMQVGITMAALLILAILSKSKLKYFYIILTSAGLVAAHYTVAYVYTGVLIIGAMGVVLLYLVKKRKIEYGWSLVIAAVVLTIFNLGWYHVVAAPTSYASAVVRGFVGDVLAHPINVLAGLRLDFITARAFILARIVVVIVISVLLWRKAISFNVIPFLYLVIAGVALFSI